MTSAFKCNGCGSFMTEAALRIERTDSWDGGGGIRIQKRAPWDLCRPCAQTLDGALASLAPALGYDLALIPPGGHAMNDQPTPYRELAETIANLPLLLREARRARPVTVSRQADATKPKTPRSWG